MILGRKAERFIPAPNLEIYNSIVIQFRNMVPFYLPSLTTHDHWICGEAGDRLRILLCGFSVVFVLLTFQIDKAMDLTSPVRSLRWYCCASKQPGGWGRAAPAGTIKGRRRLQIRRADNAARSRRQRAL